MTTRPAVVVDHVSFAFDDHVVLNDISMTIPEGDTRVLLGMSGSGKSVLLKLILGLLRPDTGTIHVLGQRIDDMHEQDLMKIRADLGMLFQESALFDSLTVAENVGYRLYEEMHMPHAEARARIDEVLGFVGLGEYGQRMPSELSGGQRRRVAIARAMAHKPRLLLLDDPTYGLDPVTATTIDDQILKLRDIERVTSLVATHGIRDAYHLASHEAVARNGEVEIRELPNDDGGRTTFMMLRDGQIYFEGTGEELRTAEDPYLREFMFMTLPPWGVATEGAAQR